MADSTVVVIEDLLTEQEAMAFLHVGKEKFKPYKRVGQREGSENMYLKSDLIEVWRTNRSYGEAA
ncbi:hypothetical protein [Bifidobacterium crudilactis]|jgi:hypothetical protein|uniref:hypothetical protein n=1 Tax=Bifidobacterium crudilactis TaxID=327277 RepID=UPI002F353FE7